jgi:hypothetical protein
MFRILQQNPKTTFEHSLTHLVLQIPVELAPHLRNPVVHQFDHMKMVEDHCNAGQMFKHKPEIGCAHVRRHRPYPGPRALQTFPEREQAE